MSEKNKQKNRRQPILFYFTLIIFGVMLLTAGLLFGIWSLGNHFGLFEELSTFHIILFYLIASVILATIFSSGLAYKPLFSTIRRVSAASRQVAEGDFSVRLPVPHMKETAELTENFNSMTEQLGNNKALAKDFVSHVSHEFRNPLSAIRGYTQLLEDGSVSNEQKDEYLKIISEKTLTMSRLVGDMLELVRLENGTVEIEAKPFLLDEQLRKAILQSSWQEKQMELELDLPAMTCVSDAGLLSHVWNNILDNAIKYSLPGSKLAIKAHETENVQEVQFTDHGRGMDEDTRLHMFDEYYRGKNARDENGSGIGLALVKRILDDLGGTIEAESNLGKGTTIIVHLPIKNMAKA